MAFLRCSPQSKCAARNCDPARPVGPVLLSHGWWAKGMLPKANSSSSANVHLGGGPGRTGEQKWEENPFQTLIGPPTQKATCQATKCQGPAALPGRARTRQTLFSVRPHLTRKNSAGQARPDSPPCLRCYTAALVSSLGLGNLISLSNPSRKSPSTILNA